MRQVSYVENRRMNMIEIVNNVVWVMFSSFDLKNTRRKSTITSADIPSTIGMARVIFRNRD